MNKSDLKKIVLLLLSDPVRITEFDPEKIAGEMDRECSVIEMSVLEPMREALAHIQRSLNISIISKSDLSAIVLADVLGGDDINGLQIYFLAQLIAANITGRRRSAANAYDRAKAEDKAILALLLLDSEEQDALIDTLETQYLPLSESISKSVASKIEFEAARVMAKDSSTSPVPIDEQAEMIMVAAGMAVPTEDHLGSDYGIKVLNEAVTGIGYTGGRKNIIDGDPVHGMIAAYRYLTMRDDRVRPTHAAMEGVTRKVDDPVWFYWTPKCGFGCRCQLVEIFHGEDWKETDVPPVSPDPGWWKGTYHGPGFS